MGKREFVYSLLKKVPKDRVTTYGELARASGTHQRAVAAYVKANRDPVGIQCFRVVRESGELGGYSAPGGVRRKAELLKENGIVVKDGKVDGRFIHRFSKEASRRAP